MVIGLINNHPPIAFSPRRNSCAELASLNDSADMELAAGGKAWQDGTSKPTADVHVEAGSGPLAEPVKVVDEAAKRPTAIIGRKMGLLVAGCVLLAVAVVLGILAATGRLTSSEDSQVVRVQLTTTGAAAIARLMTESNKAQHAGQHRTCKSACQCAAQLYTHLNGRLGNFDAYAGASCSAWEADAKAPYMRAISETAAVQESACAAVCQQQLTPGNRRLLQTQSSLLINGEKNDLHFKLWEWWSYVVVALLCTGSGFLAFS
jgi:hypothetical protein